ncbi:MAG: glycosyltransferase family 2 protein [Lachnospiraceae bacterium]
MEASIIFHIDVIQQEEGKMVIQGWTLDKYGHDIIHVVDKSRNKIEAQITRKSRKDVLEKKHIKNKQYKCGFRIEIPDENIKTKRIYLQFQNIECKKEYSINMWKIILKKWKHNIRNIRKDKQTISYAKWELKHRISEKTIVKQKKVVFKNAPLISIVIPLYNTPINFLSEIIESILAQTYGYFQLCLADGSDNDSVKQFIKKTYGYESRIIYKKLDDNQGISENTNRAMELAQGEYIMFADHDDIVAPNALYEIVKALNRTAQPDVIYTDEDKISMDGKKHFDPAFKPDYNIDLLRSSNYICHIFVVKKEIVDQIGGFRKQFDGAQDYDFVLRCCEQATTIYHIPKVLYHWRSHANSTAGNPDSKMYAFEAGRAALEEHYQRIGLKASVGFTQIFGRYRTKIQMKGSPLVSIIIPNKDHIKELKKCLKSIKEESSYTNYEILIIENNSTKKETFLYYEEVMKQFDNIRIITWTGSFNYAAINNYAAKEAKGEYLLLLNNDTEVISSSWIEEMLSYCQRDDVGIVGAKLYYPDDTIQHAGVVIGLGGIAGHVFSCTPRGEYGYSARIVSTQDVSAVTAACMMVSKEIFDLVNGFDEGYAVAFNDVDLCMKVRETGKLIVYNPYVELYHHESKSRGKEETEEQKERFDREKKRFSHKWPKILSAGDPYYNVNLTLKRGDCSMKL